jgi:ribosome-associated toxin RatA of RatAB toxin-antitoxin module
MAKLSGSATTEADASVEALWPIVADVEHWPEWQKTLGAVTILERDGEGRAALVEAQFDASMQTIRSVLRFAYDAPLRLTFTQERGSLQSLHGRWRLTDLSHGRASATYELEVEPGGILGMFLSGSVVDRLREVLISELPDELKARCAAAP